MFMANGSVRLDGPGSGEVDEERAIAGTDGKAFEIESPDHLADPFAPGGRGGFPSSISIDRLLEDSTRSQAELSVVNGTSNGVSGELAAGKRRISMPTAVDHGVNLAVQAGDTDINVVAHG